MAFVSLNLLFSFLVQLHIFLMSASSAFFFNAANEVCVASFISGEIGFTSIVETVEEVVQKLGGKSASAPRDLADVSAIEEDARAIATELLQKVAR